MDLIKIDANILEDVQKTIDECLPVTTKVNQTISDSITIANGMNKLKVLFKNPEIIKLVNSMKDSRLGFLTDKPEGKKKWNKNAKQMENVKSYTYDELVSAMIPMVLEGYRFTGNEFNIISGNGMAVKAGKFRKVMEFPGVSGYQATVGSPQKKDGIARMKCQAQWMLDGKIHSIGINDECIIAVEYDDWAGLDKLTGLAESKLLSRVLTRLLGKFVAEGEIASDVVIDNEPEKKESIKDKLKPKEDIHRGTFLGKSKQEPEQEPTVIKYWKLLNSMTDEQKVEFAALSPPAIGDLDMEDRIDLLNEMEAILMNRHIEDEPEF